VSTCIKCGLAARHCISLVQLPELNVVGTVVKDEGSERQTCVVFVCAYGCKGEEEEGGL
jgi:hypothetical protein